MHFSGTCVKTIGSAFLIMAARPRDRFFAPQETKKSARRRPARLGRR